MPRKPATTLTEAPQPEADETSNEAEELREQLRRAEAELVEAQATAATAEKERDEARKAVTTLELAVDKLAAELEKTIENRDAITKERAAMWRDYCRVRDALGFAFPAIPDPDAKAKVGEVLEAGQSH